MPHDIDTICERVRRAIPGVTIEQLKVSHPGADDDGLWFFRKAGKREHLQLESSTYNLPFIVETTASAESAVVSTLDEAVEAVQRFFAPQ